MAVAVAVVLDGGSSIRQSPMASVMDYDERTRGRRKDRQRNNQPAQRGYERAVQQEDDKR